MIFNEVEKREIIKRFHHIRGQLEGVEKMVAGDRPLKETYAQLRAIERSLHQAIYGVVDGQLKNHFASVLSERLALCPGDCDDVERLTFLKSEFANMDLKELIHELAWLRGSLDSAKQ